jgi:LEA14-like dessication related protein
MRHAYITRMSPTRSLHLLLLFAPCILLSACGMAQRPRIDVVAATLDDATADAASIDIALLLSNPNDEPLPLIEFDYAVSLDGKRVYEGRRAALATLSKGAERTLTVPAVVIYENTSWRAGSGTQPTVGITGTLRYRTPGTFADLLFDIGVRKPKASFAGEQKLSPQG